MKKLIVFPLVAVLYSLAFGEPISNLSQVVGVDLTPAVCSQLPSGCGFADWEIATLAMIRNIRTGDATNFVANATAELLAREFDVALTNGVPDEFAQAFALTSAEFAHYRLASYALATNLPDRVGLGMSVTLRRNEASHDISEVMNVSLLKTNAVWLVDGL